jgi:prepilin-type N-terminal cleavage/methylation domain-containing protein
MKKFLNLKSCSLNPQRAFTLIELMVVVSIVALFSIITLVSHQKFGDSIAINNLAYDVALTLREAQIYGTSVRTQDLAPDDFEHAYVVRFVEWEPTKFNLCLDINDNTHCNVESELLEGFEISRGNVIEKLCSVNGGVEDCNKTALHVSFLRPDPDATINAFVSGGAFTVVEAARIYLKSPTGLQKTVSVTQTGQISVETPSE